MGARAASNVKRYHTFPIIGEQNNGHHAYNMAVMLMELNPLWTSRLMKIVMLHDGVEDMIGDLPSPSMWGNEHLKREYDRAQYTVFEARYGFSLEHITNEEADWLHCLDKLEALMFGYAQRSFGNFSAEAIIDNVKDWFGKRIKAEMVPQPILEYYTQLIKDNDELQF